MKLLRVITGNQFDDLNVIEQLRYKWCPYCKMFYLAIEASKHLCGTVTTFITASEYREHIPEIKILYNHCEFCGTYYLKSWSPKCLCAEG